MDKALESLNPQQREAVTTVMGQLFVFAGAGSGKTKVITERISYILRKGYALPEEILGITFTNKAAKEMKERVINVAGNYANKTFLSTFHSFSLYLLRQEADHLEGYSKNFVIYDTNDQAALVKKIIKDEEYKNFKFNEKWVKSVISKFKSEGFYPEDAKFPLADPIIRDIYKEYQASLKNYNAVDFDDILILAERLLGNNEAIRKKWASKFKFVLIDEYQDTSRLQLKLIDHMASVHKNLMAVGDDDQTIYTWRGADINNISDFKKTWPNTKIIKLEQNYRSTTHILNIANAIISQNSQRIKKTLWSEIQGEPVELKCFYCEDSEAEFIADTIYEAVAIKQACSYKDIAILYRSNHMSRIYEEALRMKGLPYKLVGSIKFYERLEILTALSYLKLLVNTRDRLSIMRSLETPARGVGDRTIKKLFTHSEEKRKPIFKVLKEADKIPDISPNIALSIKNFAETIEKWSIRFLNSTSWQDDFNSYLNEIGVYSYFDKISTTEKEKESRKANLTEFSRSLDVFRFREQERGFTSTISGFLDRISLITDADGYNEKREGVTLMTIHSSKGLEFPTVYLAGVVDGNIPNKRAVEENENNIAEERRLMYVAVTRAKQKLVISFFSTKKTRSGVFEVAPSQFLDNLPSESVSNTIEGAKKEGALTSNLFLQKAAQSFLDSHDED